MFPSGRVYAVSKLNGAPLEHEEVSILLNPREHATLETCLPHRPISRERARKLSEAKFHQRYEDCKAFWNAKLAKGGRVELPESRINEMIPAGLLHLDLVTYGHEPEGALAATVGVTRRSAQEAPLLSSSWTRWAGTT